MEDIFNIIDDSNSFEECPKMTKDEFVKKTKEMLGNILSEYGNFNNPKFDADDENPNNCCNRCNGFLYIEQGGNTVDCPSCKGTGQNNECVFDAIGFSEYIEHSVMFGEEPFLELLYCDIIETQPVSTK